jgi:leader peptidase (prepilin peptidase) / N-methyltransferase
MTGVSSVMMWGPTFIGLFFFFAFGSIVGSFLNVVAYRLPRGENIVRPPSACPACGTKLGWSDNFPIFGWIRLRGRCRYCKSHISAEYPIVEFIVAALFVVLYALWYLDPGLVRSWGINPAAIRPEWTLAGLKASWLMFILILALISSLVAMTLIDAKTFLIPLGIPWLVICIALVTHTAFALWVQQQHSRLLVQSHFDWTIWTFDHWRAVGAAFGVSAGLIISNVLLKTGQLKRSFADYDEWEKKQLELEEAAKEASKSGADSAESSSGAIGPALVRTILFTGPAIALMGIGFTVGLKFDEPMRFMLIGMAGGLLIGLFLRRLAPDVAGEGDPIWVQYPHARREMVRELLFLAPAILLGVIGFYLAERLTGSPPLWIKALTGSLLGLLIGGGVVWAVRILGSLAFGKEAMGLGDVHLMAAIGAVLGWVDPVLAFFIAPFFGIAWFIFSAIWSRLRKGPGATGTALPYGPHLAAATIVVIYAKPAIEIALSTLMSRTILLP